MFFSREPSRMVPTLFASPDARMWTTTLEFNPETSNTIMIEFDYKYVHKNEQC